MIVANNLSANNAQRQLNINNKNKSKSEEKLFSGVKINTSADDAAGLAISEKLRWQIKGLTKGVTNCQDGISLCQVADGAMAEVHDMLHRMSELCVQSANDTNTDADREAIDREIQEIKKEIDRIGNDTTFNEIKVLQGTERLVKYEMIQQEVEKENIVYLHVKGYGNVKNPYISTYFPKINSNQYYDLENISDTPLAGVSFGQYDYNKPSTKCFIVDFSNIQNQSDWEKLDGVSFTFVCAQGCGQMFSFYLDNSQSGVVDMTPDIRVDHNITGPENSKTFLVGTKDYSKGSDLVNDVREYVKSLKSMSPGYYNTAVGHDLQIETSNGNDIVGIGHYQYQEKYGKFVMGVPDLDIRKEVTKELIEVEVPVYENSDIHIQYGAKAQQALKIKLPHIDCEALDMLDVAGNPRDKALESLDKLQKVVEKVSEERSNMGAYTNAMEHLIAYENNTVENVSSAESRIRDTNMAEEMLKYSRHNILEDVGNAMLVQANQSKKGVLKLLE